MSHLEHVIRHTAGRQGHAIGPAAVAIVEEVLGRRRVSMKELMSQEKTWRIAHARQEVMYALYATGRYSLPTIGAYLSGRDHTTVLHGVRAHEKRLAAAAEAQAA